MGLNKQQQHWLLGLGITAGILGIGTYLYKQYQHLYNATYKISNAVIHNIALNNIKFSIKIKLTNKGDLSAWITSQNYDILFNGTFVANIKNTTPVHINANGSTYLPLTIEFNPSKLLSTVIKNLASLLVDRSKILFSIKGTLSLRAGIVTLKSFTFDMQYTLQEIIDIAKAPSTASFVGYENKMSIQSVEPVNVGDGRYKGFMSAYNVRMNCKIADGYHTMEYCNPIKFKTNIGIKTMIPQKVIVTVKDKQAHVQLLQK